MKVQVRVKIKVGLLRKGRDAAAAHGAREKGMRE